MENQPKHIKQPNSIADWRNSSLLFYLRKNRADSKIAFGGEGKFRKKNNLFRIPKAINTRLFAVYAAICLLVQCSFTNKGLIAIFNHSSRKRTVGLKHYPLYLPNDIFNLEKSVVFEDSKVNLVYPKKTKVVDTVGLYQIIDILSSIVNKIYYLLIGIKDKEFFDFIIAMHFFKIVLRIIQPSKVYVFVWYAKEPLIAACKILGIEVCDLQHGTIYSQHPNYNIHSGKSIKGSDFLLPDKCLVYGKYWKDNLIKCGWDSERIEIAGYFVDTRTKSTNIQNKPYILYSSQPHTHNAIISHINSIKMEAEERGLLILIAIHPHPSEITNDYYPILSNNIKLVRSDIYDLMRGCMSHISVASTLLIESCIFEKPSYALGLSAKSLDYLQEIVNFGYIRPIQINQFPEHYPLPKSPEKSFFFANPTKKIINS
jgi:hypothetical protein